jgi:thymidylate synthase (FAD)
VSEESVHDHGFVRLDGCMADDLSVVNSARVSFGAKVDTFSDADTGLINFLMRERHGTPFEHNSFRFHISCPIFVAREWFRHRIGSFNEISGRYTRLKSNGYVPYDDYVRSQTGKPGAYTFEPMDATTSEHVSKVISDYYRTSYGTYNYLVERGVAKEIARLVLPVGTYTEFYWTVNARALMNFLSLRTHDTAQREIRDYAFKIEKIFAEAMPVTYEAWKEHGRVAP